MGNATEYDVLVNLKVGRDNARVMGGATKSLRQGLAQAERDQQRMHRAEMLRAKAGERERIRILGFEARRKRQHDAVEARAAAQAERRRRQIEADRIRGEKRAAAEVQKRRTEMLGGAKGTAGGASGLFSGVGTGGAAEWATSAGRVITGVLAGAIAAGLAMGLKSGFEDNINREQLTGKIGTTLQLFDFNALGPNGKPQGMADQYAENLSNAQWYQNELQRIADQSPGDIGQVTELFSGILPGMAAITQDAQRINDLTQKTTLLAAVLGNQFALVGEQSSRILSGGAGAEMETWRTALQKPIRDAGILEGTFKKNQELGEKLTLAFNKLAPEKRLELFEKALQKLGKPVSDYFENSFDGIVSQATSSLMMIRREFGRGPFEAAKTAIKQLNKTGALRRDSSAFKGLMDFSGFLGKRVGEGVTGALNFADRALTAVGNNWETIVTKAQTASHYLVSGAKLAVSLMAVRSGIGLAAGAAGGAVSGIGAIASATATIAQLGMAAGIALPAIIALGVVTAGAGIMFGGVIAYAVSNIDDLSSRFTTWTQTAGDVIDPFFMAIDTLGAKFEAMGAYILGAGDNTDIFSGVVLTGTSIVETLTTVFSELIGMTAGVIETFASVADFFAGIGGTLTGGGAFDALKLRELYAFKTAMTQEQLNSDKGQQLQQQIENLENRSRTYTERAANVVSTIRGAKTAFDNAQGGREPGAISWALFDKMHPMGPAPAPRNATSKTPPKVNVKQTVHNTWYVRDTDPNAIVAGFNKKSAQQAAQPIRSALAMVRRR